MDENQTFPEVAAAFGAPRRPVVVLTICDGIVEVVCAPPQFKDALFVTVDYDAAAYNDAQLDEVDGRLAEIGTVADFSDQSPYPEVN